MTETMSSHPRRRRVVSVMACAGLLITGAVGFSMLASLRAKPPSRAEQKRIYQVDVFRVERQPLREIMTAFGTARSDRQVVVAAQVAGEIVEVHPQLRVGLRLPPRQSEADPIDLVVIDEEAYAQKVIQAERRLEEDDAELARLAQDKVNKQRQLEKARGDHAEYSKEFERIRELKAKGVATQSDFTKVTLELRRYEDQVIVLENASKLLPLEQERVLKRQESHQSDLALARLDLKHARVRAPFGGVLGEVHVEKGQYVRPGEPLVRLVDDSVVEVPVSLTASDYMRVRAMIAAGRRLQVALAVNESDAPSWNGRMTRVAPEVDELTRTARAFVVVENRDQKTPLVPGTFVHVRIVGPELSRPLVIPRDAINVDENEKTFVWAVTTAAPGQPSQAAAGTATTARQIQRRYFRIERTFQTLALVDGNALQDGDLIVLTNLDALGLESLVRLSGPESYRTLDQELDDQRMQVLRRVPTASGAAQEGVD
ncbi:MAG: hypothetical protein CMJ65_02670 [Planctomycetaceae bacterium]|nr:hypothetical protein [Planctomycetaceae bacterium]